VDGSTPADAIKARWGLGGRPFQEEEGAGMAWGGDGWVLRALDGRGSGSAPGIGRPSRLGRWGGAEG
jgi:hypothetical protein